MRIKDELFGKEVADIVLSVTSDKVKQKELGKSIYLSKKMLDMNDKSLILKLCDRLDNVSGLDVVSEEFNEKYIKETSYIINYLLLNRELNNIHLEIINDIMNKIKEVSYKDPIKLVLK
jgi:(p)ppGpp synthase/HD superfamily hydrolase